MTGRAREEVRGLKRAKARQRDEEGYARGLERAGHKDQRGQGRNKGTRMATQKDQGDEEQQEAQVHNKRTGG